MVNEILHNTHRHKEEILKTRNRMIEAVWRVIVGNDTPIAEDGELIRQDYIQTEYGQGRIYNFMYKRKLEAVLTEVQRVPGQYSYFLHADREMIGEVVENVTQIAMQGGSDNAFCQQDCACEALMIERVYQTPDGRMI